MSVSWRRTDCAVVGVPAFVENPAYGRLCVPPFGGCRALACMGALACRVEGRIRWWCLFLGSPESCRLGTRCLSCWSCLVVGAGLGSCFLAAVVLRAADRGRTDRS